MSYIRNQIFFVSICSITILLSQSNWETAVYAEDTWNYFVGNSPPPENWNELNFDTSSWNTGRGYYRETGTKILH